MSEKKEAVSHLLFVDGLRAIAALYVVMHHIVLQQYTPDNINTLSGFERISISILFQGHLAVDLFIVISGFSLMLSVLNYGYKFKKGFANFFKRRAIRILPPYYCSILLSLLLIHFFIGTPTGTHWDISLPVTFQDIAAQVLLVHDLFISHQSKINHALWSVAVECRIYLLFPLLLWLWRKSGAVVTLISSVITIIIIFFILNFLYSYSHDISVGTAGVNPYLVLFVLGMLAADISFSQSGYKTIKSLPWGLLTVVSITVFSIYKVYTKRYVDPQAVLPFYLLDILFGLIAFSLLITCSKASGKRTFNSWLPNLLSWKPLVFIGTFSYSLYLIHAPLIQMITQYIVSPLHVASYTGFLITVTGGLILIVMFAYLFFLICERPLLNMLKNREMSAATFEAVQSPAP